MLLAVLAATAIAAGEPLELPSDVPLMVQIDSGTAALHEAPEEFVALPKGFYMNEPGYVRLGAAIAELTKQAKALEVENETLKATVVARMEEPHMPLGRLALFVGGALVVGAGVGWYLSR
jgi:hypothetical protein